MTQPDNTTGANKMNDTTREQMIQRAKEFSTRQNIFPFDYIYELMADFHLSIADEAVKAERERIYDVISERLIEYTGVRSDHKIRPLVEWFRQEFQDERERFNAKARLKINRLKEQS